MDETSFGLYPGSTTVVNDLRIGSKNLPNTVDSFMRIISSELFGPKRLFSIPKIINNCNQRGCEIV